MAQRKTLHFDSGRCYADFRAKIIQTADDLLNEYYAEIYNKLQTVSGKRDLEKLSENQEAYLKRKVIGYANAIMDSYGTGSQMDTSNPFLSEYKNSDIWNDLRTGNAIVGRSKGRYKNIYGSIRYSTGSMAGKNIENRIKPRSPSYAFQHAQLWFTRERINKVLNIVIREFIKGMYKYFEFR